MIKQPSMTYTANFTEIDEARQFIAQQLKAAMVDELTKLERPTTIYEIISYYEREFKKISFSDLNNMSISDYANKQYFHTENNI
jgi:hypothetical protein